MCVFLLYFVWVWVSKKCLSRTHTVTHAFLDLPESTMRAVAGLLTAAAMLRRAPPAQAMFSGIVEEMGAVQRLEKVPRMEQWDGTVGEGWELDVKASEVLDGASPPSLSMSRIPPALPSFRLGGVGSARAS